MNTAEVERKIDRIPTATVDRYLDYWQGITPNSVSLFYRRWLFAYSSIQTSWRRNVLLYHRLVKGRWNSEKQLRQLLEETRVGLQNNRAKYIWDFHSKVRYRPHLLIKPASQTWAEWRDDLTRAFLGIGIAKVSFALEMCYPSAAEVVCLDRHILRLYDIQPDKATEKKIRGAESHWLETCLKRDLPSPMVRHILWDEVQKQDSTRYWSHVLE